MALTIDKGFEVEGNSGIVFTDGSTVVSNPGTPMGLNAPSGTIYYDSNNGHRWRKFGIGDNDWYCDTLRRFDICVHKLNDNIINTAEFFFTWPTNTVSSSFSGFNLAMPFTVPYNSKIIGALVSLSGGEYENRETPGNLSIDFDFYNTTYNGATQLYGAKFVLSGSYTGYLLGTAGNYKWYTTTFTDNVGTNSFPANTLLGVRWYSTASPAGNFYYLRRPTIKFFFEELYV